MGDRRSGILVHPTSLPGPDGIGDCGPAAFRFVDWLQSSGQRLWQILPLTPIGAGNSPYSSPSAFAGNPLLVSLDWLAGDGLLPPDFMDQRPHFPAARVDYAQVSTWKKRMLDQASSAFFSGKGDHLRDPFREFREVNADWLDDYCAFTVLKAVHGDAAWTDWPAKLRDHESPALDHALHRHSQEVESTAFQQFLVHHQWKTLRRYANELDIQIIGDIPIYVAHDSADVWANRHLFRLHPNGSKQVAAGVPPDAFSADGQFWGNPHYRWAAHAEDGYRWWTRRISRTLDLVDLIRIDHFRGFAASWVIPAEAATAATGRWELGSGKALFDHLHQHHGSMPFIVEDLGVITPDVVALRDDLGLPGMKVLHFAFGGDPHDPYLPHMYERGCVVYPATHDNQTTVGWFSSISELERERVRTYLGRDGSDIAWDLIRLALGSVAERAVLPLQDVLRLGDEARMNVPGVGEGNWEWRCTGEQLDPMLGNGLATLTRAFGRSPENSGPQGFDPWDYTAPNTNHPLFPFAE
ncbi:MAG: 4-alpha-glucanotransferase [Chloroflexota bacterium]